MPVRLCPCILSVAVMISTTSWVQADSVDVGSFTKSTSGAPTSQVVAHNLGETPKLIFFWTVAETNETISSDAYVSLGMSDGSTDASFAGATEDNVGTSNTSSRGTTKAITIVEWDEVVLAEADVTAWDSDDFTLNWTTNNATAYVIHFMAIGGTGVSGKVVHWTSTAGTGNRSVTGVGFEPDVVIHIWLPSVVSVTGNAAALDLGMGVMDSSGDQWALSGYSPSGQGTANTTHAQAINSCIFDSNYTVTLRAATFVSMDSDGFTVNFSATGGAARPFASLCISGVNAHAGSFAKSTSTAPASQAITGVLFEPDVILFASYGETSNGLADDNMFCIGAADGSTEGCSAIFDEDAAGTMDSERVDKTTKVLARLRDDATANIDAEADLTSFDNDGFTLNWTTNDTQATQILYLAMVPFSAVSVRLQSLQATRFAQGVDVEWRSEVENDNLGFNVYRQVNSQPTQLNTELIRGSAFMARAGTSLTTGQCYRWWDRAGGSGAEYWVEAIDLNGGRTMHGPIVPQRAAAGLQAPVDFATLTTTTGLNGSTAVAQKARVLATDGVATPLADDVQAGLASRGALKIGIVEEGWYRVTGNDWIGAGLPADVDPRRLQLFVQGQECAIVLNGATDGSFDATDSVEFYALGVDTLFTDTAVYWLIEGDQPGARIATEANPNPTNNATHFTESLCLEEDTLYFSGLLNGAAENFFGAIVSADEVVRSIALAFPDQGAPEDLTLTVALQGLSLGEHFVEIEVDGVVVGSCEFEGRSAHTSTLTIPWPMAAAPVRVVLLASSSSDLSLLDTLSVSYPRRYLSGADMLRCTAPEESALTLSGFPSSGVRVFDVTDAMTPRQLVATPQQGVVGTAAVVTPAGGMRTLFAHVPTATRTPAWIRSNEASKWRRRAKEGGAEYVIVCHHEFIDSLRPLAEARRAEGLMTRVIDIEDLYDEFSFGMTTPQAVRDFLAYAATEWESSPRYLLLVGDATYDPRGYIGSTNRDLIPTQLVDTALLETASDAWFGDIDADGVCEVAVGRFPVETVAEADLLVQKTLSYAAQTRPEYRQRVLMINDNDDSFPFQAKGQRAAAALPATVDVESLDLNGQGASEIRQLLVEKVDRGQGVVVYYGHGGTTTWAAEGILTATEASQWSNSDLPIVLNMSCLNGFFHRLDGDSLSEALLKAPGGGVAVWASTGLVNPYPQSEFTQEVLEQLYSPALPRLGDVLLQAQLEVSDRAVRRTAVLLGDPTLRFQR